MRWRIQIWMIDQHARSAEDGYWSLCCWAFSAEMVGILERALTAAGQRARVTKDG